jgi:spore maturation protein CgeB
MRLFRAYTVYPEYVRYLYAAHPGLEARPFAEQKAAHDAEAVAWGDAYTRALAPLGYEVLEIPFDIEPMQRAWAAEQGMRPGAALDPAKVLAAQVRAFKPDVLWYDHHDENILRRIRHQHGAPRLVAGWVGSHLGARNAWKQMDLILSCAPESTAALRAQGLRSEQIHHAFDDAVFDRLRPSEREIPLTFIGSIVRRRGFHLVRDRILSRVVERLPLAIHSPSLEPPAVEYAKMAVGGALHLVTGTMRALGVLEAAERRSSLVRKAARVASAPRLPVNPRLRRHLKPPVFGLGMYQLERDSAVVLNIHADSSPTFASNMRLFEAAGVGSCLLTDWRENIGKLFEPDREVVTYRSADECVEKATWLLGHPEERAMIARAGRARVLRDHTFARRAVQLDGILRGALGRAH